MTYKAKIALNNLDGYNIPTSVSPINLTDNVCLALKKKTELLYT